jgi:hypothetical protein
MMACWLIRHDFIKCPTDPNEAHQKVYGAFREALYSEPLLWNDGSEANWKYGLLDRGGHRPADVDFICSHMTNVKAYVGLSRYDDKKPAIFKSEKGEFFLGQPQMLSDYTGTLLASDQMYFPWDTGAEYFDQIWRQFFQKKLNSRGEQEEVWVHGYAGDKDAANLAGDSGAGPDHLRDCMNLAYAAAKLAGLDKKLFSDAYCKVLGENKIKIAAVDAVLPPRPEPTPRVEDSRRNSFRPTGGYFRRSYGRR